MVSIMSMPETVIPESLPASRIITRVMLMRLFAMIRETTSCKSTERTPTRVSSHE